jgi:hypothetical protein
MRIGAAGHNPQHSMALEFVRKEDAKMLWTLIVLILLIWLVGVLTSYTLGGLVHLLLLIALIMLIYRLATGRRLRV